MSDRPSAEQSAVAPASYPMVDEAAATGRVAVTYAAVLNRFPMVPSLFKSLATCPTYLQLAWEQTRHVLDVDEFQDATAGLVESVVDAASPHPEPAVRQLLGRFVQPLAQMSVVAAGLRLALDGDIDAPPATAPAPAEAPEALRAELDVPATSALDPHLVGVVRRDLGTPIINSIWRVAAARGLLADVWDHLGPLSRDPARSRRAAALSEHVDRSAVALHWPRAASPAALETHGIGDAAAGARAILDAYLTTLPRVLTLVASNRPDHS